MGRLDELISAEFARWEQRGRGWKVWPQPVRPESPFAEFTGYRLAPPPIDDSRRPGLLASLFDRLEKKTPPPEPEETVEPEPTASEEALTSEFVVSLPASLDVSDEVWRAFLSSLDACAEPVGFELLGTHASVTLQLASSPQDAPALQRQLRAFLPELTFTPSEGRLAEAWHDGDGTGFIVDFGLAHEFMLPLQTGHAVDPFVGLVSALNGLQRDEAAVFQVLFQPVQHRWPASVWRSVTDENGKALFVNRPHLIPGTKQKLEVPLFGVVVRVAAKAADFGRASEMVRDAAFALRAFTREDANRLIPLHNEEYAFADHEEDLLQRQSRRSGMLLNRDELLGFVHLPGDAVSGLQRQRTRTKAAPAHPPAGVLLGYNEHAGRTTPVHLSAEQRVRHTHIIGANGTGKSTLLFNLIRQDIESGQGLAVLDPHGDLIEQLLGVIPEHRREDVIFFDPTDEEFSVGFNILSAHSDFEKNLIASDLVSVFRRLSTSWGDQLNSVLNNAILAFLESSRGGTLADLRRFLIDASFRNDFLQTVGDPDVVYYWRKAFPQLGGNKSIGPVLTRLDTFLGPKPIRYMVSQQANKLDFARMLDGGKIFLAKLSQGHLGRENAFLLGSLLVSKFQQMAMSRQRLSREQRRDFWIYLDEFHNFITPSMAEILTGARKYRVGLTLAHHELHQLQRDADVASAVLSNPSTRVVFRVGDADAAVLAKGFSSFDAKALLNLGTGEAVCRMERSDGDFNLRVPLPELPDAEQSAATRAAVVAWSRRHYATPRADIEAAMRSSVVVEEAEPQEESATPKKKKAPPTPPVAPSVEPPIQPRAVDPSPTPPPTMPEARQEPVAEVPPLPAVAEVRNETRDAPVASQPVVVRETPAPRDLGMGGAQHQLTQKRIKLEAEALGFLATIEKSIPNGSVDVLLERAGLTIACEIGVTTPIDHECGNVAKCLQADFQQVAVISRPERLRKIAGAVAMALGAEVATRVGYYTPDGFIVFLKGLPAPVAPPNAPPAETIRRGRKVRVKVRELTPEERKEKEAAQIAMLAELMRRKSKP